jgi:ATP-dependent protease ClpP protease subunit
LRPSSIVRYVVGQSARGERAVDIFSPDTGRNFFVDAAGTKEYGIIDSVVAHAKRAAAAGGDSAKE